MSTSQQHFRIAAPAPAIVRLAVTLAAFLSTAAAAQSPVVRDSAGITIIQNSLPAPGAPAPVRVSPRPAVQIGVVDGPAQYQFNNIVAATRLSDGSIAVADRGSAEIRVFDPDGKFVRKMGRKGYGPGEFQSLYSVRALAGDSLRAWDSSNSRLTTFTSSGTVANTFTITGVPEGIQGGTGLVRGSTPDGSFYSYHVVRTPITAVKAARRDTLLVALYNHGGHYTHAIGQFLGYTTLTQMGGSMPGPDGKMRAAWSVAGVPFPRETYFAVSTDWLYAGDGDASYEARAYDHSGSIRRIIRLNRAPQGVTDDIISRFREQPRTMGSFSRPGPDPQIDKEFFPETMPAYGGMLVDAAQRLWVKDYPVLGATEQWWSVFNRDGKIAGRVRTPDGLRVLEVGTGYILGVWRDDMDVEYVRMYTLQPAR